MAKLTDTFFFMSWGRDKTSPDNTQKTAERIAVAPISEVEKGMKKHERTTQKIPAVLVILR